MLGSNSLFAFIIFLVKRHDEKKESPEKLMLRALGSDRLYEKLTAWKHSDERLAEEWGTIDDLYKGYRALGGNGEIRKLYEECSTIPTTD